MNLKETVGLHKTLIRLDGPLKSVYNVWRKMHSFFWPTLNASLNATSLILLILGFIFIKSKNIKGHRISMGLAFATSAVFLACYLWYHFNFESNKFGATDTWLRVTYFTILISHIILAVFILPFIFRLLYLALKQRFDEHKKMSRWVWPLWVYTSASGVLVYFFLYIWFPATN